MKLKYKIGDRISYATLRGEIVGIKTDSYEVKWDSSDDILPYGKLFVDRDCIPTRKKNTWKGAKR